MSFVDALDNHAPTKHVRVLPSTEVLRYSTLNAMK